MSEARLREISEPRFRDCGEAMLVVEFGSTLDPAPNARVLALDAAMTAAAVPGVIELVPTFRSLAVHYDPLVIDRDDLVARVRALEVGAERAECSVRRWVLPASFEGPHAEDLAEAAARLGMAPERLVGLLCGGWLRLAMYGFAPGFAYLGGVPADLALSRRVTPRPPHLENAILIAGGMAAVARHPMPTGWWVVGAAAERTFDLGRDPNFVFAPGDEIRFEPVDAATFAALGVRVAAGEIVARREAGR